MQAGESRYVFETKTIQRMELVVLNTLKWRMQSVTPFSFIDSFIGKVNDNDDDDDDSQNQSQSQTNSRSLIYKSTTQLVLSLIRGKRKIKTFDHKTHLLHFLDDGHKGKMVISQCRD